MNIEQQYLDLLNNIIDNGIWKDNRTGIRCKTIANTMLQHDMSNGFPLMTHRQLYMKSTAIELEGFLKGITSKKWYQERGCKYWDHWANPEQVNKELIKLQNQIVINNPNISGKDMVAASLQSKSNIQKEEDDLGPIYGYQWRKFDEHYGDVPYSFFLGSRIGEDSDPFINSNKLNGIIKGSDQLKQILLSLINNPNDRRMVCSAWNPNQISMAALPSCHVMWGVIHLNGVLNLWWIQRSCDTVLGIPANISSYATLLLLLCKYSGFTPGILTGYLCDTHIYENHLTGIEQILSRTSNPLPTLTITHDQPFELIGDNLNVNWTHKDYKLKNYNPLPPIKFPVAV